MTAFGDDGPWSSFRGSDLVHLALGGPMMNCGYDPQPDGTYDLPPIAPQAWHSYIIAGEQLIIGILAALVVRQPGHPAALAGVSELSGFPERSSSANRRRRRSCPRSRDGSPAKTRWTQS
jgi:crotonobetainyl-CoA:carnitine CoA-transferase CaiB-like acyl-CoA transferase